MNLIKHAVTETFLNEFIYEYNLRNILNVLNNSEKKTILDLSHEKVWKMFQNKAIKIITFINVKIKLQYNWNH